MRSVLWLLGLCLLLPLMIKANEDIWYFDGGMSKGKWGVKKKNRYSDKSKWVIDPIYDSLKMETCSGFWLMNGKWESDVSYLFILYKNGQASFCKANMKTAEWKLLTEPVIENPILTGNTIIGSQGNKQGIYDCFSESWSLEPKNWKIQIQVPSKPNLEKPIAAYVTEGNKTGVFCLDSKKWILEPLYDKVIPKGDHYYQTISGGVTKLISASGNGSGSIEDSYDVIPSGEYESIESISTLEFDPIFMSDSKGIKKLWLADRMTKKAKPLLAPGERFIQLFKLSESYKYIYITIDKELCYCWTFDKNANRRVFFSGQYQNIRKMSVSLPFETLYAADSSGFQKIWSIKNTYGTVTALSHAEFTSLNETEPGFVFSGISHGVKRFYDDIKGWSWSIEIKGKKVKAILPFSVLTINDNINDSIVKSGDTVTVFMPSYQLRETIYFGDMKVITSKGEFVDLYRVSGKVIFQPGYSTNTPKMANAETTWSGAYGLAKGTKVKILAIGDMMNEQYVNAKDFVGKEFKVYSAAFAISEYWYWGLYEREGKLFLIPCAQIQKLE